MQGLFTQGEIRNQHKTPDAASVAVVPLSTYTCKHVMQAVDLALATAYWPLCNVYFWQGRSISVDEFACEYRYGRFIIGIGFIIVVVGVCRYHFCSISSFYVKH